MRTMTAITLLAVAEMLLCCGGCADKSSSSDTAPQTGAAVDGLRAHIETDKPVYNRGEKITLTFTIHNTGKTARHLLFIRAGWEPRYGHCVTIRDAERVIEFSRKVPQATVFTDPAASLISIQPRAVSQETCELSSWQFGEYFKKTDKEEYHRELHLGDEPGTFTIVGHIATVPLVSLDGVRNSKEIKETVASGGRVFVGELTSNTIRIRVE